MHITPAYSHISRGGHVCYVVTDPWDGDFTVCKLYLGKIRVAPPERQHKVATLEDGPDENMAFSTSPIHYSGSHWAVTYRKQQEIDNRR